MLHGNSGLLWIWYEHPGEVLGNTFLISYEWFIISIWTIQNSEDEPSTERIRPNATLAQCDQRLARDG